MPIEKLAIDNKYPSDVYLGIESVKYIYKDTELVYSKKIKIKLYLDQGIDSVTYIVTEKDESYFSKTIYGNTSSASSFEETVGYGAIIEFKYSVADGYTIKTHPLTTSISDQRNFYFTTKLDHVRITKEDDIDSVAWVNVPKDFILFSNPEIFDNGIGAYSKGVLTSESDVLTLPSDSVLLFKLIGYNDKVFAHGVVTGLEYDYHYKAYRSQILNNPDSEYVFNFSLRRLCAVRLYSPITYDTDSPSTYASFQVESREYDDNTGAVYKTQAGEGLIITNFGPNRVYTIFAPIGSCLYIYDFNTTSGYTLSSIKVNDSEIDISTPPYLKILFETDAVKNGYYTEDGVFDKFSVYFNFKKSS